MIKNATIYRMSQALQVNELNAAMQKMRFTAPSSHEASSMGFEPFDPEVDLAHKVGDVIVGVLRLDKKQIPASAVKERLVERCREAEEQQGFAPGRKQKKEIKEQIVDEFLSRALCATKRTRFYIWDDLMVIESTSASGCDAVIGALAKSLDPFPVAVLHTEKSPSASMTEWLVTDEPPSSFSIDQEVEMRAASEARASVRWLHESTRNDEVQTHYKAGKGCIKMAMTWADKVSFKLNDKGILSSIKALDVLNTIEGDETEEGDVDATIALHAGEIYRLSKDLIEALGGIQEH